MEYGFKVGDRVMGTKDALSHRVGKFGRVTRPQGKSSVFVLWDGADQDHFVHKNEIVRIEEEPMYNVTQEPKMWGDMTPEEKGTLLLAEHEGKVIEYFSCVWKDSNNAPQWFDNVAYRIKPEPKRETVVLYWKAGVGAFSSWARPYSTHRITFDIIDGKPDPASIKIEEV